MSTVRIYKVAELLNATSQEVLQLLKKNHGIELKSASSTLEEIVARQFVERLARQRGIELPKGDIFSESAVKSVKKGSGASGKKSAAHVEPAKPAAPSLPPPRLIKTQRPPTPPAVERTGNRRPRVGSAARSARGTDTYRGRAPCAARSRNCA